MKKYKNKNIIIIINVWLLWMSAVKLPMDR